MEAYVPDYMVGALIVRSVILVLSPILMGLVLAGRVGAGIASELGTMKVSEQVDALTSLAVDPVGYLMLPRVIAGLIMIPILVIYSFLVSIACGFVMSIIKMNITPTDLIKGMKLYFENYDVFVGLVKSAVYGGLLTFMGAYMGLCTQGGAQGVGRSATASGRGLFRARSHSRLFSHPRAVVLIMKTKTAIEFVGVFKSFEAQPVLKGVVLNLKYPGLGSRPFWGRVDAAKA